MSQSTDYKGIPSNEAAPLQLNSSVSPQPFDNNSKRQKIQETPFIADQKGNVIAMLDRKPTCDTSDSGDARDYIDGRETIDFKGKLIPADVVIEADNSVRLNATAHFGQLMGKIGCQHLTPAFDDDDVITLCNGSGEINQLWYSTVVIPGFEFEGPVHPSPQDPCRSHISLLDVKKVTMDCPLRAVHFNNKRDARNAAVRQAHSLFMDYVRSKTSLRLQTQEHLHEGNQTTREPMQQVKQRMMPASQRRPPPALKARKQN